MGDRYTYRIQYVDNTYQLVNWTEDELNQVFAHISHGQSYTLVSKCIFRLTDIRAIVHLPSEEEQPENPEEPETVMVTDEGVYDKDLYEILVSMGYDLGSSQERRK